jgi:hypothetical protein
MDSEQLDLFERPAEQDRVGLAEWEVWLDEHAPSPLWYDGYQLLRAQGVRFRYAALAVWLSLRSDDRGDIRTRADFANLMGVARATTYQWEERQPVRKWAELLRLIRLRGSRLSEVDERTYEAAKSIEGGASDRKLYYQRAGVWTEARTLHLVGADDGPVEYTDVTKEEIDAIRRALTEEAARGGEAG